MVSNGNAVTSVTRHRSSSQIAKEEKVTSIIADNQIIVYPNFNRKISHGFY
ncbi:MAG: hypothetical protein ACI9ZX_001904 [Algoriphagus sp.]|jgi:hypothetical protein